MSNDVQEPRQGLTRRQVLRRAAFVGAAAWSAPVIQSINPARAWAQGAGTPRQNCQSVIIDSSGNCWDAQGGFTQITPTGESGGCESVNVGTGPEGDIVFSVPEGTEVVDGAVVNSDGSSSPPLSDASGEVWKASGGPGGIDHVELTICAPLVAATGPTATGPSGPTATGPSGAATGPSGAATGPSGSATGPTGPAPTGPSGSATGPSGPAPTGPSGS